jgi:ABC-type multidrug transport system ATPase subunit
MIYTLCITSRNRQWIIVGVEELIKQYSSDTAADSISLPVAPRELFGFLGPNGAGKTTTIKILTTLLRPTSGRAMVAGYDVLRQPARVRSVIGYVAEGDQALSNIATNSYRAIFRGATGHPAIVMMRKLSIQLFALLRANGVSLPQGWPEFKDEWLSWFREYNNDPEQ